MSSTASDPDPDPAPTTTPPPTFIPTANSDIDVAAQPAIVVWRGSDGEDQSLPQLSLDLHYNARSNKAFFKLRIAVALKAHPRPRKTNVFLFIHPERIRTVALNEAPCSAEAKTLGPDAFCLRFDLKTAPALVVPKESLAPRNQTSGSLLDSLRALAQQTTFAVYSSIPCRTLPRRRLLSLCEAASSDGLRSIAAHSNITSLYAGNGGKVIETETFRTSAAAADYKHDTALELPGVNPPAYDERPARSEPPGPSPLKKRRRSSPQPPIGADRKYIEDICAHIDSKLADLRRDVTKQLQDLETRVIEYVDESLSAQRKDITEDIGDKIEDEYYGLKLDLQNYYIDSESDSRESPDAIVVIWQTRRAEPVAPNALVSDTFLSAHCEFIHHRSNLFTNAATYPGSDSRSSLGGEGEQMVHQPGYLVGPEEARFVAAVDREDMVLPPGSGGGCEQFRTNAEPVGAFLTALDVTNFQAQFSLIHSAGHIVDGGSMHDADPARGRSSDNGTATFKNPQEPWKSATTR
ncbi:hypothetical protein DL771_006412 [Monosporascus sp. 5C6A]|nr:hypothetical protein DL771_006412 [Monosporascus sp. 5C6A]